MPPNRIRKGSSETNMCYMFASRSALEIDKSQRILIKTKKKRLINLNQETSGKFSGCFRWGTRFWTSNKKAGVICFISNFFQYLCCFLYQTRNLKVLSRINHANILDEYFGHSYVRIWLNPSSNEIISPFQNIYTKISNTSSNQCD